MPGFRERSNRNISKSLIAGALGGLAAAYAMNQFQTLWTKAAKEWPNPQTGEAQPESEDATVKTANGISRYVFNRELSDAEKKWAGPAVHYVFGTLTGAAYGVLAETVQEASIGAGTVFGSAVWLAADEIGVPAFGLAQSSSKTPLASHVKAFASHLVYGVTTELTRKLVLRTAPRVSSHT